MIPNLLKQVHIGTISMLIASVRVVIGPVDCNGDLTTNALLCDLGLSGGFHMYGTVRPSLHNVAAFDDAIGSRRVGETEFNCNPENVLLIHLFLISWT